MIRQHEQLLGAFVQTRSVPKSYVLVRLCYDHKILSGSCKVLLIQSLLKQNIIPLDFILLEMSDLEHNVTKHRIIRNKNDQVECGRCYIPVGI